MTITNGKRITREDLEAAFTSALGDGETTVRNALPDGLVIAGAVALSVVVLSYLAGRRRGRRRSSVIEIHRI